MVTPMSDSAGIRQAIRALRSDGWTLESVYDGEEMVGVNTETEAISVITSVDEANLYVAKGNDRGYVFFVLGNSPEDVIADYTVNLEILDKLTEGW